MIEVIRHELSAKVVVILFLLFTIWWVILRLTVSTTDLSNQLFAALYGVIALWGGLWGIAIAKQWGGLKSIMGRAIAMFAFGLFLQEFGQLSYSYYIYALHQPVPYPSIGDIGYFGSIPFYIYGAILLGNASGMKFSFRSVKSKMQAIIIPFIILASSYIIFLQNYSFDWSHPLTIFLDFGYPFGQAIYISLALLAYLLSRKLLGGIMKYRILFILFALLIQYASDWTFLYQASKKTWYAGGLNDYMYLASYTIMTLALIQLKTVLKKMKA